MAFGGQTLYRFFRIKKNDGFGIVNIVHSIEDSPRLCELCVKQLKRNTMRNTKRGSFMLICDPPCSKMQRQNKRRVARCMLHTDTEKPYV